MMKVILVKLETSCHTKSKEINKNTRCDLFTDEK